MLRCWRGRTLLAGVGDFARGSAVGHRYRLRFGGLVAEFESVYRLDAEPLRRIAVADNRNCGLGAPLAGGSHEAVRQPVLMCSVPLKVAISVSA